MPEPFPVSIWLWDDAASNWVKAPAVVVTHYGKADATVKATAGLVYWITIKNVDAANWVAATLRDGGAAGAIKWSGGVVAGLQRTFHAVFNPPMPFATDIYVDLAVGVGVTLPYVIIGYI